MFSIYILVQKYVIHCIIPTGCVLSSSSDFALLLFGGFVEMIFEITGVIKIFRKK